MSAAPPASLGRQIVPFAGLSASYFAHIGFFNPYLPLWLKHLGLPIVVISLLASVQSFTRVFAPYIWGALSDHTGERVRLLRFSAGVALLASVGLWFDGGPVWIGLVLLLLFTHTSSMMSLTEAAMAHLVAGDWGRYGRIRLWGSMGFMLTVFLAGAWFERFGMGHFPGWTALTLAAVLGCTWWLPDVREKPAQAHERGEPIAPVLRQPAVRWFFASLLFHVMAHFAIYGFLSLYLDARGYSKAMIGVLWAVSVLVEILWFFWQGRLIGALPMTRWLVVCGAATALRMALTGGAADWLPALFAAQVLHALTFATHHTACIAMVTRHFPGRLRGRGQALFTVIGYGIGGVTGVLAGGALASRFGFEAMYGAATLLGLLATACAWRMELLEQLERPAGHG
ncbi:MFS transporter [Ramlibacter tataouinensis]|uniref:Candidate transporter n=1 Tax=Ramlibacter tataouinensis (strain ATCC BAA-407 / DSM 14655 / LMG 21543 / TTB310) TaxID=365046 RepID=F5Y485_RAMTT|nr:MFS transporter [Ramlibacter tataouinensis]AEG92550.1 Candidate transporter [Ramlibacter tataouinensis TTB310]